MQLTFRRIYKYTKNVLNKMFYKKEGESKEKDFNLTPKEWVLALLYANKEEPIKGKLMFVKLMFLLSREIDEVDKIFNFYPAKYGPYSIILAQTLNNLIEEDIIKIKTIKENDYERTDFFLSDKGIKQAEKIPSKLSEDIKESIFVLREKGKKLGYTGIIRYVYSKYPEYAISSNIAEEF